MRPHFISFAIEIAGAFMLCFYYNYSSNKYVFNILSQWLPLEVTVLITHQNRSSIA